jgi:hypothetical protein
LEVRYDLPTLDLTKDDTEWLWHSITDLFMADSGEPGFRLTNSISVTTPEGMKLEEKDLQNLLRSSFMTSVVKELTLSFWSDFGPLTANESRRLILWINDKTHLSLNGTKEWTERAHGLLGDWLKRKASKNKWPRAITAILLWGLPESIFVLLAVRFQYLVVPMFLGGLFWVYISIWKVWDAASKMYPVPSIMIGGPFEWPWYVRWSQRIVVGLGISIVATFLLSLIRWEVP